jgi:glycine/D-amino acid oxidase-like deaminating enzyme
VQPRPDLYAHVRDRIRERLPETAGFGPAHSWAGLIELTPDSNPIAGWTHLENMFTLAGFSGHGMCLAPGLAPDAARLLRGEEPVLSLQAYEYARFQSSEPLQVERLWSGAQAYSRRAAAVTADEVAGRNDP